MMAESVRLTKSSQKSEVSVSKDLLKDIEERAGKINDSYCVPLLASMIPSSIVIKSLINDVQSLLALARAYEQLIDARNVECNCSNSIDDCASCRFDKIKSKIFGTEEK